MRTLTKNLKVLLSAGSLIFCSYAGADAGFDAGRDRNVEAFSPSSLALNAHTGLHRVSLRNRKPRESQGPVTGAFAIPVVASIAPEFSSTGVAPSPARSLYDELCPRGASARAPPIS